MQDSKIQRWIAFVAVIAVIVAAIFIMLRPASEKPAIGENEPDTSTTKQYDSAQYGIAFTYPDGYVLTEQDIGNSSEREHHAIAIIRAEDAANVPEAGEGPTAITIDIYGNKLDRLSTEAFVQNTSASNFKISVDGTLSTSTVAGSQALKYTWDGLYRGDSTVFSHKERIYMFTVTYMDSAAVIRDDYAGILGTLVLR